MDLELLQHFGCHAFKLCTNNPQLSYQRFSAFPCAISGGGSELTELSRVHGSNFTKLRQIAYGDIAALHFCFRIRISCCIFNCGRLKVE